MLQILIKGTDLSNLNQTTLDDSTRLFNDRPGQMLIRNRDLIVSVLFI